VARGDLGVEVPIEEIAIIQKQLIAKANIAGKPVITAIQILEIHDLEPSSNPCGIDRCRQCHSRWHRLHHALGESAIGQYPEQAVAVIAKIAAATEPCRPRAFSKQGAMPKPSSAAQAIKQKGLALNGFRHFNATMMDSHNVPVKTRQTRLGHDDPRMTIGMRSKKGYTHMIGEDDRRAAAMFGDLFGGKVLRPDASPAQGTARDTFSGAD
jgi:pyruvate kinase